MEDGSQKQDRRRKFLQNEAMATTGTSHFNHQQTNLPTRAVDDTDSTMFGVTALVDVGLVKVHGGRKRL